MNILLLRELEKIDKNFIDINKDVKKINNKFNVKASMYLIKDGNTLKEVEEETLNIFTEFENN